jgi:hypothetical protein
MSKKQNLSDKDKALQIGVVVCGYSPFPQSLTAGKNYEILAKHKDSVAIIDDTKELNIYHKCYFNCA